MEVSCAGTICGVAPQKRHAHEPLGERPKATLASGLERKSRLRPRSACIFGAAHGCSSRAAIWSAYLNERARPGVRKERGAWWVAARVAGGRDEEHIFSQEQMWLWHPSGVLSGCTTRSDAVAAHERGQCK